MTKNKSKKIEAAFEELIVELESEVTYEDFLNKLEALTGIKPPSRKPPKAGEPWLTRL